LLQAEFSAVSKPVDRHGCVAWFKQGLPSGTLAGGC